MRVRVTGNREGGRGWLVEVEEGLVVVAVVRREKATAGSGDDYVRTYVK